MICAFQPREVRREDPAVGGVEQAQPDPFAGPGR